MKKMLLILLSCMLMISVSACASNDGNGGTRGENKTEEVQTKGGNKTVIVSMLFVNDFFKEAKQKYEAKYPNVKIELKYLQTADKWGAEDLEKYIKTTNTELLAGKGADVIFMDPLPLGKYVNNKVLANMSVMMEQDPTFQKDEYFDNILDNVKVGDGIYSIPLGFGLSTLLGDEEAIGKAGVSFDDKTWTWSQLTEAAKQLVKQGDYKYAFANFPPESMLAEMVTDNYAEFVDVSNRKAKFESESFTRLLQQVKAMYDEKIVTEKPGGSGKAYFSPVFVNSPKEYFSLTKVDYAKGKVYQKPSISGQHPGGYFYTNSTLGINDKSSVKAEAWDFVKFLLSEEMQDIPSDRGGFPINKGTYEKQLKQLVGEGKVEVQYGPGKGKIVEIKDADVQALKQFVTGASNLLANNDPVIKEMISKESEAYFSGQKSTEEVGKLIQNRVTTYLNE
ncbi:ABC transporter substrate-binding protein [Paenibacillus herberti]|uniref:ABC transporter substrate-binding protein n=1 Tax=Paenibacillus herberti TaxID=1619309 RepID=A0A229P0I0_9BACL|nr:extracellular solute-binding protein [Paenibacillus herberti]OXM15742.1 ABC transporter substrate-binding protein [Paenibacillus herberti]